IYGGSLTVSDVAVFSGPSGSDLRNRITGISAAANVVTLQCTSQPFGGVYRIAIGPDLQDLAGNKMDQDGDGIAGNASSDYFYGDLRLPEPDLQVTGLAVTG